MTAEVEPRPHQGEASPDRAGCMSAAAPAAVLPDRIGPCELGRLGAWITVCCPRDLAPLVRQAGGLWEPGSRRWLVERRRLGPLLRALRRDTDPLFRRAGIDLDTAG